MIQPIDIIRPALRLLGEQFEGEAAERLLLAIGYQESGFDAVYQKGGPAHGYWQFEQKGGVQGVLYHPATRDHAERICKLFRLPVDSAVIYVELPHNAVLAACFARLLLWPDSNPLPMYSGAGWDYYIRNWRPGRPRAEHWNTNWKKACLQCKKS